MSNTLPASALSSPTRVSCCDGRIDSLRANGEPAIRLPGTTVLVPESEWPEQAKKLRSLGVVTLDSHEDCGAAGKAFEAANGRAGTAEEVNAYAEERVRAFCAAEHFTYGKHITKSDMRAHHHDESVLYYDASPVGTKKFEQAASGLVQGFELTESACMNPHGYLLALIGIAFGPHGAANAALERGEKFRVEIVAPTDAVLAEKILELGGIIAASPFADKTIVGGFVIDGWQ